MSDDEFLAMSLPERETKIVAGQPFADFNLTYVANEAL